MKLILLSLLKDRVNSFLKYSDYLRNQHGLVLAILHHELISVVGHGVQMRRHFGLPLATVLVNKSLAVDGEAFVWVDSHTEKTGVGL